MHFVLLFILFLPLPQQTDPAARFNRAVALQQEGRLDEAVSEYRAVISLKPDYAEAHANLGVVLARLGKYEEAVSAYETARRLAPQLTPILLNLGIAHYRAGQFARAAEVFPQYLERDPNSIQARQLYGLSLAALGRDEEAIRQLEPTLESAPPDAAVLYTLGLSYLRAGRPGLRAVLERLASFPGGLPALHLLQGQAFLRDREFEQALDELKKAEKLNPELPRLQFALGLAHLQIGQNRAAIAAFETELRRTPADAATLYYLASALEADGNLSAAQQRVSEALRLDPQSPDATGLLGRILFKQGRAAEAVRLVETAVSRRPDDQEQHYLLARIYQQLGRREDAAREFATVQKLKAEQLKKDRASTPRP
ncbi:MAG TPA: tetratricopeptide repeat protein [Blastocatellia bacterium]|nr:tetratricopeptide repeat protein [Blastocatellia bacterium]